MSNPIEPQRLRGPRVVVKKSVKAPARESVEAEGGGGRGKKIFLLVVALVLLVWGGWAVSGYIFQPAPPPDPDAASSKDISAYLASGAYDKLSEDDKNAYATRLSNLPDDRRREIFDSKGMNPDDQRKLGQSRGRVFGAMQLQTAKDYFKLSPEAREVAMDKAIADEDARFANRGSRPTPPPPPPSTPSADNSTSSGKSAGASSGGGGGPRRFGKMSPDRRQQFQEMFLSSTTPENRAYVSEYRRQMQLRRQAMKK